MLRLVATWKNYQSYLLSNQTPDGKVRSGEELPLSTTVRPTTNDEDINRTNIYFFTTDTADNFVIPVVEKKKAVTPKVLTPGAPQTAAPTEVVTAAPAAPVPTQTFILDGKTPNTFITPQGKKLVFIAPADVTKETSATKIKFVDEGDLREIVANLKAGGKDPGVEISKVIFYAITPTLNEMRAQEAELTVTIPDDVEEVVVADAESKMGKPISQSVLDAVNKKISGLDNEALRVVIEKELKTFVPENWSQVETWLKDKFPTVPVYRVKNIIQATNGRQAWGMFKDGAIYIYENAEVGTVYHEVFHAVWRTHMISMLTFPAN